MEYEVGPKILVLCAGTAPRICVEYVVEAAGTFEYVTDGSVVGEDLPKIVVPYAY